MTTIEQLEARMHAHELDDSQKHGTMLGALGRIETHLGYLVKEQERLANDAENTGSHLITQTEKRAEFWPNAIRTVITSLVTAAIVGLVSYLVMHR